MNINSLNKLAMKEEDMERYIKPVSQVCETRAKYRASRKETAVKVYTINQESIYLIVRNIPANGSTQELLKSFALYGPILEWRMLDQTTAEEYTDVVWIKYQSTAQAKQAKKSMDDFNFYSNLLNVCYAPEYESAIETWNKLQERRMAIMHRIQEISQTGESVPRRGKRPLWEKKPKNIPSTLTSVVPFAPSSSDALSFPNTTPSIHLHHKNTQNLKQSNNNETLYVKTLVDPFTSTVDTIRTKLRKITEAEDPLSSKTEKTSATESLPNQKNNDVRKRI